DGSVGSPHVRVGNCQASNKTKGSVGRLGLLFLCFAARRAAIFPGGAALTGATDRSPGYTACGKIPPLKSSLKLSHLPLADSTFCLFLVIVSYLDV
ncbi:hypothetical protein, partial [Klebsiella aerogenes]